jgi:prophage tail gpP-like protein
MTIEINDRIRNRKIEFFNKFSIHSKYDSLGSNFEFDFLFDPDNIEHKEVACIGHYHLVKIKEGNDTLMTGYIINQAFNDGPEQSLVELSGYSLPGMLQECEIPFGDFSTWIKTVRAYQKNFSASTWPTTLQSDGLSLKSIVEKIIHPFGLKMVIDPSVTDLMNEAYDETTAKESQSAKSYICELAAQKNIVVTDDQFGRIVFKKPLQNQQSIFHFNKNIPGTKYSLVFPGDKMHSHIKAYQQQDINEDIPASENMVENPYVPFVFRPHVTVQNSGDADNTENMAKNVLASELKNFVLTITTDRWKLNSQLLRAGQIISVTNPNAYIYKKTRWFVEEVTLKGDPSSATAVLKCVLPCVYDGSTPKYIFEGINLH